MSDNKRNYFWTSYADLMTSLFFIMLLLFVLTVVMMWKEGKATKDELKKIREIESSINKIDTTYFEYNEAHKKHILKIDVSFKSYSFDLNDVKQSEQDRLKLAGSIIYNFIIRSDIEAKYLLIIEGQSSRDRYYRDEYKNNDVLSYQRALALYKFWKSAGVFMFENEKCEVIVSGSGENGSLRKFPDDRHNIANQRFLIHIIPKPGIIKRSK